MVFIFLWTGVDGLRNLPIGPYSPSAVGFPLGFIIGIIVWRRFRESIVMPVFLIATGLIVSILSFIEYEETSRLASESQGLNGLIYMYGTAIGLTIFMGSMCVLLSGILGLASKLLRNREKTINSLNAKIE